MNSFVQNQMYFLVIAQLEIIDYQMSAANENSI